MHMVKQVLTKHKVWQALSWYYFIGKRTLQDQTLARFTHMLRDEEFDLKNRLKYILHFSDYISYFLNLEENNKISQYLTYTYLDGTVYRYTTRCTHSLQDLSLICKAKKDF